MSSRFNDRHEAHDGLMILLSDVCHLTRTGRILRPANIPFLIFIHEMKCTLGRDNYFGVD